MSRIHWSEEQKAEFWSAFVIHRDAGCKIREAYRLACADLKAQGKEVPGLRTFQNWYHKAMQAVRGPMDGAADGADSANPTDSANNKTYKTHRTYKENAGTDEAARDAGEATNAGTEAEAAAEETAEAAPDLDYTHRLEMMVRLYRTRSEAAVDAVCDRLLPELADEEEV